MSSTEQLDNLKLDADALKIPYRSDIKAETLQKKIDEHNKENNPSAIVKSIVSDAATNYKLYKNTSGINVFTEGGKCRPNGTVELTSDEAKQYKDLELCT